MIKIICIHNSYDYCCPNCGSNDFYFPYGYMKCKNCGWSDQSDYDY